ncbi:hypothetical protein J7J26_03355 [Candidatus Micrarchaeota archaeon]|nr:hypothetical protein [Candidatus Micrarchaeota archaeon]
MRTFTKYAVLIIFLIGFQLCWASVGQHPHIKIINPIINELSDGSTVYVGTIGPGQTIPVLFDAITETGGKFGTGGRWDKIKITSVPDGWRGFDSKLHENPLQISVKANPYAEPGNYTVRVRVIDENNADLMGNITLTLIFTVNHNIYSYSVEPDVANVGTYQPVRFNIHIYNKGNAPDMFTISTEGLTSWKFRKTVYVPAKDDKKIVYEVVGTEEETCPITINIKSESSPLIHSSKNVTVNIRSDIKSDYKSVVNGMLIFPVTESTLYAFIGLLSNIL